MDNRMNYQPNKNTKERTWEILKKAKYLVVFCFSFILLFSTPVYAKYTTEIDAFSFAGWDIPAYDGDICEIINNNEPKFTKDQYTQDIYCTYGELDSIGRVTACYGNLDHTLFPTEARGDISSVYPTGWVQKKYDFVNGSWLYNRSHLIMWALTGQNANKNNLMTGTRTFNTTGMLEHETKVLNYLKADNENNVLYRVTPVFEKDETGANNLLATGVIMEASSVDDNGKAIDFAIFVYNVEPGVAIDYKTGESAKAEEVKEETQATTEVPATTETTQVTTETQTQQTVPTETTKEDTHTKTETPASLQSDIQKEQIITAKNKTYKYKTLKKKSISFFINAKTSGDGKLTYQIAKYPRGCKKYIKVSGGGKVTLKKGIKKGTYQIKITAKATKKYKKSVKTIIIRVK